MARGWESKDVASQVEETEAPRQKVPHGSKSPEQIQLEQQRQDLQLSRTRIMNDWCRQRTRTTASLSKPPLLTSTRNSPSSASVA